MKPKNRCSSCGSVCVPAVDNYGDHYMGCPRCIIAPQCPHELYGDVKHRCSLRQSHTGPHFDGKTGERWEIDPTFGRT